MKIFTKITAALLVLWLLPLHTLAMELIAGGQVIGLQLSDGSVYVAGVDEEVAKQTGAGAMEAGDRLLSIDGKAVTSAEDVRKAMERSGGTVQIRFRRGSGERTVLLKPQITPDGPKLGLYLRQGITGIGTVTYYDPETGAFGTLGHGVNDSKGKLLTLTGGNAYTARVLSVRKGLSGEPGQLMGTIASQVPIGSLSKNTARGVFGAASQPFEGQRMEVAEADRIKTGAAVIRSTVNGQAVREYSVEILKIYPKNKLSGRNLLLRVTDPALLELTGGIVQGMSGSPIIQDGKLIGAVTHVLVNDPTTGYGIFIENMLDAAA